MKTKIFADFQICISVPLTLSVIVLYMFVCEKICSNSLSLKNKEKRTGLLMERNMAVISRCCSSLFPQSASPLVLSTHDQPPDSISLFDSSIPLPSSSKHPLCFKYFFSVSLILTSPSEYVSSTLLSLLFTTGLSTNIDHGGILNPLTTNVPSI